MIDQEMFHVLITNRDGRHKIMAWSVGIRFHYCCYENMGFSATWINLIIRCITCVKYHVLMNGQTRSNIVPKRALRQEDYLSIFIFIYAQKHSLAFLIMKIMGFTCHVLALWCNTLFLLMITFCFVRRSLMNVMK